MESEDLAVKIVNEYVIGRWPKMRQLVESVIGLLEKGWDADSIRKAAGNWLRAYERDPQRVFGSEEGLRHFFNWKPPAPPNPSPVPTPLPNLPTPAPFQTQDTQDSRASQATQDSRGIQEIQDLHRPGPAGRASLEEEEEEEEEEVAEAEPIDLSASALYSQRNPEDYEARRQ